MKATTRTEMKKIQNNENCTEKARIAFDRFMEFLSNQNKLVMGEDMIQDLMYTYMDSPDGITTTRCILWRGVLSDCDLLPDLIGPEFNAQLNIEVQFFGGTAGCFVYILYHKNGERLDKLDSWVWENEKEK